MNHNIACLVLAAIFLAGCETDVQQQRRLQHEQQTQLEVERIKSAERVQIANYEANKRAETARFRAALKHKLLIIVTVAAAVGGTIWAFLLFRAFVIRERIKAVLVLSDQMTDEQRRAAIAGLLAGAGADARTLLLEHKR